MGFNEAVRNINVQKYLGERDKLSCQEKAGHRSSVMDTPGDLLAKQGEMQEKRIEEALKKGREKTIKQANKELKEIIDEGNKKLKRDFKKLDEIAKELPKEFKSRGGVGGDAGFR